MLVDVWLPGMPLDEEPYAYECQNVTHSSDGRVVLSKVTTTPSQKSAMPAEVNCRVYLPAEAVIEVTG